tara:strand:- start:97 stop:282 length:186 start_codon:yes stop_codon:yes gene_type:complete
VVLSVGRKLFLRHEGAVGLLDVFVARNVEVATGVAMQPQSGALPGGAIVEGGGHSTIFPTL